MNKNNNIVFHAIAGDIIGSYFEFENDIQDLTQVSDKQFESLFFPTDETFLTIAVLRAMFPTGKKTKLDFEYFKQQLSSEFKRSVETYPMGNYGSMFLEFIDGTTKEVQSSGSGCITKLSPVFQFVYGDKLKKAFAYFISKETHNSEIAIKSIKALMSIMGDIELSPERLKQRTRTIQALNNGIDIGYSNDADVNLQRALIAFNSGDSFKEVMNECLTLPGDSDTICSLAGMIASGYDIPPILRLRIINILERDLAKEDFDLLRNLDII